MQGKTKWPEVTVMNLSPLGKSKLYATESSILPNISNSPVMNIEFYLKTHKCLIQSDK